MTELFAPTVIGCDKPGISDVWAVGVNVTPLVLRVDTMF